MTQAIDIKRFWWAVGGSNSRPIPCQGPSLGKNPALQPILDDCGRLSFTLRHYTPWAIMGQIDLISHPKRADEAAQKSKPQRQSVTSLPTNGVPRKMGGGVTEWKPPHQFTGVAA